MLTDPASPSQPGSDEAHNEEPTVLLSMPSIPVKRGRLRLALVAHDAKKADLVEWVAEHSAGLADFELVATGTTGQQIMARCPELMVHRLQSGPLGGDQQLGALIVERQLNALIFFFDPLSALAHDSDVKALMRIAALIDIPCALNRASAQMMIPELRRMARERRPGIRRAAAAGNADRSPVDTKEAAVSTSES